MILRLISFVVVQVVVFAIAAYVDHTGTLLSGYIFHGVVTAQFALLGLFCGIGSWSTWRRWLLTLVGVLGLSTLMLLLRTSFNGWEFLLTLVRTSVLCVVFTLLRKNRKLVLRRTNECANVRLFQLTLKQLFAVTFVTATFLALGQLLDGSSGSLYGVLRVIWVVMVGIGLASVPVIASAVTLSKFDIGGTVLSVTAVIVIALFMSIFAYSQTNSWEAASQWFTLPLIEATVVGVTILALRMFGYCLTDSRSDRRNV